MKSRWMTMILLIPLISCNSFLDIEPENSVTFTNYFQNEAEVEALFTNILSTERKVFASVEPNIHDQIGLYCTDIYTSNTRITDNIAGKLKMLDPAVFLHESLDQSVSWKDYYDLIYLANMMIDNEFRFKNIQPERTKFWLAQAWFTKGLCYYTIARMWGDAPIVPNSEFKQPLGKSPAKAVLEEALRCAKEALVLPAHDSPMMINAKGNELTSKQYASLGTVYTLMANIYAWMGGLYGENEYWREAEAAASKVIEKEVGYYQLEPMATLCENVLGNTRRSAETIFAIEINAIDRNYFTESTTWHFAPGSYLITYPVISDRESDVVNQFGILGDLKARIKSREVKSLYAESADLRRSEFWKNLGAEENNGDDPYAYFYKWRKPIFSINAEAKRPYLGVEGNKIVWRLADLILLRGECRARLGLATASEDLNAIRERAGLGKYAGSNDLRKEIFRERERELFGEGQRYDDAVRNGYLYELSPAFGELSASDIERGALYLPISKSAFTSNTLMRQNIYWSWKK
ncbi:MAG: RagB/SusD family nutrient uptake outer membrane protein [Odoribacter sp.]